MFCLWNLWDFLYIGNVICEHGFTSSFPVWMLFLFLPVVLARTSGYSVDSDVEGGHPSLVRIYASYRMDALESDKARW